VSTTDDIRQGSGELWRHVFVADRHGRVAVLRALSQLTARGGGEGKCVCTICTVSSYAGRWLLQHDQ
jgi:hypothetical protein